MFHSITFFFYLIWKCPTSVPHLSLFLSSIPEINEEFRKHGTGKFSLWGWTRWNVWGGAQGVDACQVWIYIICSGICFYKERETVLIIKLKKKSNFKQDLWNLYWYKNIPRGTLTLILLLTTFLNSHKNDLRTFHLTELSSFWIY